MTFVESARPSATADALPAAASATLAAYALVSIGSSLHGDVLLVLGVPLTTAGFVLACLVARSANRFSGAWPIGRATMLLSALAAVGLVTPALDDSLQWFTVATRIFFAAAIVLIGVFEGADRIGRRRVTIALAVAAVALQFAACVGVHVTVDVWSWTQTVARALLHGVHPYTVRAADLQRGGFDFGSTPTVYPYMPLTVIAAAPWVAWFGDYRAGIACCLPITIALLRRGGRALDVDATFIDVATLALVLHPFGGSITAIGYMEPLLVTAAAAFVFFAATAPRGGAEATAFLLLPALKQYVAAPVLLYVAIRGRVRPVAIGVVVGLASVVPFLLWRWRPTLDGMFYFVRAPLAFRTDSDSLSALLFALTRIETHRALAIVAQAAAAALAWRPLRDRGLEGLLLASAISLLASFLVAPQAFTNYYYFGGALLLLSSLAAARAPGAA
jgi:hypothetical protein